MNSNNHSPQYIELMDAIVSYKKEMFDWWDSLQKTKVEEWTFLLVTIHVVIGTLWSLALIMMTGYASRLLKSLRFIRWMDRLTGGLFMFFAVKLVLSHR